MKKLMLFSIISLTVLTGCGKTYTSEITYRTDSIPAQPAETKTLKNIKTKISGDYTIGLAPKKYLSGEEKEFTTSQSGNYVAGDDFPIGVYDLVPVSGSGNVSGSGLNEIMSPNSGDFYTNYFDNKEFFVGDSLDVSGVSIKLVPQTNDDFSIPAGTYNLKAIQGQGNVSGCGLNEIMGSTDGEYSVKNFDNAELNAFDILNISGVQLELEPKEKEVVVKEATAAIPGETFEETYTVSDSEGATPVCTSNSENVDCSDLTKLKELKQDIEDQKKADAS